MEFLPCLTACSPTYLSCWESECEDGLFPWSRCYRCFSKCWDPHRFCCRLFFSKKIPPEKNKQTHTQEKSAGLIFWGFIFWVALKIPMISKIPGWVSLPVNDLQSTLSLPTRQIARNASAVPGCPCCFSGCCRLVTLKWWLSTGNSPKMALIALWTKGEGLNSG